MSQCVLCTRVCKSVLLDDKCSQELKQRPLHCRTARLAFLTNNLFTCCTCECVALVGLSTGFNTDDDCLSVCRSQVGVCAVVPHLSTDQ